MKISIIVATIAIIWGCNVDSSEKLADNDVIQIKTESNQFVSDTIIERYASGKVKISGNYVNNKREGLWISFFENGSKQSVHNYKEGMLNGQITVFNANSNLLYQGFYIDGKKHGKWNYYNNNQEIINTTWYNEEEKQ